MFTLLFLNLFFFCLCIMLAIICHYGNPSDTHVSQVHNWSYLRLSLDISQMIWLIICGHFKMNWHNLSFRKGKVGLEFNFWEMRLPNPIGCRLLKQGNHVPYSFWTVFPNLCRLTNIYGTPQSSFTILKIDLLLICWYIFLIYRYLTELTVSVRT
jgi:hypothetical protein